MIQSAFSVKEGRIPMKSKIAGAVLLAISLAALFVFTAPSSDATVENWNIGSSTATDVTASYDSNTMILTITANVDDAVMMDWTSGAQPGWHDKTISDIVFSGEGDLTNIGDYAFSSTNLSLKSLVIPSSVTDIGAHAFEGRSITSIAFASTGSVTVGEGAFYNCSIDSFAFAGPMTFTSTGTYPIEFYDGMDIGTSRIITASAGFSHHTFYKISGDKYGIDQRATESSYRVLRNDDLKVSFTVHYSLNSTVSIDDNALSSGYTVTENFETFCADVTIGEAGWAELSEGQHTLEVTTDYGTASTAFTLANTEHTVTFHYNNGSADDSVVVDDGNTVSPKSAVWSGFTFNGWYRGDDEFEFSTQITEDTELDAKWVMNTPILDESEFTSAVYKGEAYTLRISSVTPSEAAFQWQKKVGNDWYDIEGATRSTLELTNVDDSGIYRVEMSVLESSTLYIGDSSESTLTIARKDVTLEIPLTCFQYNGDIVSTQLIRTEVKEEKLSAEIWTSSPNVGTYSYIPKEATKTGSYYFVNSWGDSDSGLIANYKVTTSAGCKQITIEKRSVSVSIDDVSFTYDSKTKTYTYTLGEMVEGETLSAVMSAYSANAGEYTYTAGTLTSGKYSITCTIEGGSISNYSVTVDAENVGKLTISKRNVTVTAKDQTIIYGNSVSSEPSDVTLTNAVSGHSVTKITITASDGDLVPSDVCISTDAVTKNYTVTYENGKLTVEQREITITANEQKVMYGNTISSDPSKVTMSYKASGDTLCSIVLTVSGDKIIPSGAVIKNGEEVVTSRYSIQYAEGDLEIVKRDVELDIPVSDLEYNGTKVHEISVGTDVGSETLTAEISLSSSVIGVYTVYDVVWKDGTGDIDNYSVTTGDKGTLTVKPAVVTLDINTAPRITYDGVTYEVDTNIYTGVGDEYLIITLTASSVNAGIYYSEGTNHYTLSDWKDGTGSVGNYNITTGEKGPMYIDARPVTVTPNNQTIKYGGTISSNVTDIVCEGVADGQTVTSVILTGSIIDVGTGLIEVTTGSLQIMKGSTDVTSNYYVISEKGQLTIERKPISMSVNDVSKLYDGEVYAYGNNMATGVKSEKIRARYTASSPDAGIYTYGEGDRTYTVEWVSESCDVNNYEIAIDYTGTYTISKYTISDMKVSASVSFDGNTKITVGVSTGVGKETLSIDVETTSENVGVYEYGKSINGYSVTGTWYSGTGKIDNYTIENTSYGKISITSRIVTLTVNNIAKTYDGEKIVYTITTDDMKGLIGGDKVTQGKITTLAANAGSYTVIYDEWDFTEDLIFERSSNYDLRYDVRLQIDKRPITLTSGTSSAVEDIIIGDLTDSRITVGGSGFVGSETFAYVFTGRQSGVGSSMNTFDCYDSTGKVSDYQITYVFGTLKIMSKDQTFSEITTDSSSLSIQTEADLAASAEYYLLSGSVRVISITTTQNSMTTSSSFMTKTAVNYRAPVLFSYPSGKILLTGDVINKAISGASSFTASLETTEKKSSDYIAEYEVKLIADSTEIHELGASLSITFFMETSKMFPIDRDFKVLSVSDGQKFDTIFDESTGEITFTSDHLSDYAILLSGATGGPSFTSVILVIVISAILIIASAVAIFYLKKKFYI